MLFSYIRARLLLPAFAWVLCAVPAVAADQQALLWEVRSANNLIYLLGTVHVGRPEFYPLPAAVERAYQEASVIALEVDPTDREALNDTMRLGTYEAPQTLEKNVSRATFESLQRAAESSGLPLEVLQSMKPFLAALMLTTLEYTRLGYDPQLGVDLHLATRAVRDGKKLVQLESARSQMEILAGMSRRLPEAFLDITLRELSSGEMGAVLQAMTNAWKFADLPALQRALTMEENNLPADLAREFHEKLLTRRNSSMLNRVESMIAGSEICLVAIGAGHLIGDDGLPTMLAQRLSGATAVRRLV